MKTNSVFFSRYQCLSLLVLGLVAGGTTSAADVDAGKTKSQNCVVCHGAVGISQMPSAPSLAGQSAIYVTEQLKNFRSGKRNNEIMNVIAKPLSDTEISNLAAWYESIKIEVRGQ